MHWFSGESGSRRWDCCSEGCFGEQAAVARRTALPRICALTRSWEDSVEILRTNTTRWMRLNAAAEAAALAVEVILGVGAGWLALLGSHQTGVTRALLLWRIKMR